jgi:hypothetical protein
MFFSCSVACGMGHSVVVVDRTNVGDRLDQVIIQKRHSLLLRNLLVATASCSLVSSVLYDVQSLMAGCNFFLSNAIL